MPIYVIRLALYSSAIAKRIKYSEQRKIKKITMRAIMSSVKVVTVSILAKKEGPVLSRVQKRFNKLTKDIDRERKKLIS